LFRHRQPLEMRGVAYRYHVALQPSRRRWWFALDTPAQSPDEHVQLTYDYQLLAAEAVSEPVTYTALSYTHTVSAQELDPRAASQDTLLPPAGNARTHALARALRARNPGDAAYVSAVLAFLRNGGFAYSLTPERLGADQIDDFLFNTREGFCGHYASAFVFLMRAGGVPARVVTGYLGGEWNPIGQFFIVRQSDAHAWAEVWLLGRGWTRVDPTAVVAPERLRRGIFDFMPEDAFSARERLVHGSPFLTALLQRWDALDAWWTDRVVQFDYNTQLNLLQRLGIRTPDARYLGWAFMAALCAWLVVIAWHVGRGERRAGPDELARAYLRLCRKLAHVSTARAPHQGPLAFARQVIGERPDLKEPVQPLIERYAQLRYGASCAVTLGADVEAFARAVKRVRFTRRVPSAIRT
jgi:protein-glutamine gamma-glutamyltransferase